MKTEYDLFKEGEVPKDYIEAHVALMTFINKAWDDGVYISTKIGVYAHRTKMYLDIAGASFPMVSVSDMEQFIAGQHEENATKRSRGEDGEIKEEVLQPTNLAETNLNNLLRECKLGCSQLSPLIYLFKKYADEFHAFEVRYEREGSITCFAKLNDVWFSNIGNPWRYSL